MRKWLLISTLLFIISMLLLNMILKMKAERLELLKRYSSSLLEITNLKKIVGCFYINEGRSLKNDLCLSDKGIKSNLFDEIKRNKLNLVLLFNQNDCSSCVESVLFKLGCISHIKDFNFTIISDFNSISSMKYLKLKYKLDSANILKMYSMDTIKTPCIFLIDNEIRISKFFILNKDSYMLSSYLEVMDMEFGN